MLDFVVPAASVVSLFTSSVFRNSSSFVDGRGVQFSSGWAFYWNGNCCFFHGNAFDNNKQQRRRFFLADRSSSVIMDLVVVCLLFCKEENKWKSGWMVKLPRLCVIIMCHLLLLLSLSLSLLTGQKGALQRPSRLLLMMVKYKLTFGGSFFIFLFSAVFLMNVEFSPPVFIS